MSNNHNIEYSLDCEGSERTIFFVLRGHELRVTLLERKDPKDPGPDWTGATGLLCRKDCEKAAEDLREWISTRHPMVITPNFTNLVLYASETLFAWRAEGEEAVWYKAKADVDHVNVHVESVRDANYLHDQFMHFTRLLRR